nr:prenyltransferase/squalene oxidase repeat-containing protein [uncultured Desulfobacter sp.]
MKLLSIRFRLFGRSIVALLILLTLFFPSESSSQNLFAPNHDTLSLKHELTRTYQMAYAFFKKKQNPDGSWSDSKFPALTGLAVYALLTSPEYINAESKPDFITQALDYIISNVHENGGIYNEGSPSYNTSICLLALLATRNPEFYPTIIKARNYIATCQMDQGKKGIADKTFDGGIGYGSQQHPDMHDTCIALEAIQSSQFLESDHRASVDKHHKNTTLNRDLVLNFITRCQNFTDYNEPPRSIAAEKNKGGFVDYPGFSKAGEETLPNGIQILRTYGSMTCTGLLSFAFTDFEKDDPRVQAAYEWLKKNYTLDENPGLGQQGLYYYYYSMAKALTLYGDDNFLRENGRRINWRKDMAVKFINKQKSDGSWLNEAGGNWENGPVIVTAYVLISLNMITALI